ncbi:MAG: LicD family protein, partial [Acetatifactor sp.]|nr:LicD family protein [Acetatifactor sp.]
MLEFQDGFFDQEVRDGFYLDTTMKTLWAAELEVLQKVAEVCDRHGLKWYAAYGTLLGAIRHEGFVPWDDDMDIWVKRPDYNILMQVLPKELPEGYLVRSPLTEEGYDQYHTCINNGNGISISKEWLDQYHGCPFTVGLDIFPLDYLPRDEKDRELQKNLLTMAGRIAQLAKNVGRGDYDSENSDSEENAEKQNENAALKESVIEEINLGIEYLEENCKLQIDHRLLEDEDWYKVSSELWKWANYLAMMYKEEESDYIVEYIDYLQYEHKIYPKKWFADGYSASFENFMIPVPAGYDNILRLIYYKYLVRRKKTGTHEYPYYARQLRQLREYVKNIEQRAKNVGLISIDEIEVKEESKEFPAEWVHHTILTLIHSSEPTGLLRMGSGGEC